MNKTKLSVNVNKIALLRNARDENLPNVCNFAKQCLSLGAHGITVHPRPDQRHVRYDDLLPLKNTVNEFPNTEFNIEGYPSEEFCNIVCNIQPHQVTLVPDPPEALTSSFGWSLPDQTSFLEPIIKRFQKLNIRVSIFIDPNPNIINHIAATRTNNVELYTYDYVHHYHNNKNEAIKLYKECAKKLKKLNIGINAGHDLNLDNLTFLIKQIPAIQEVSIGHALVCDALQVGLKNCITSYLACLK